MSNVSTAIKHLQNGYACSQAILLAYGGAYGFDGEQALKVSAGFGGGMHLGEVCGAVTGAFMVLGLAQCDKDCNTRAGRNKVNKGMKTFTKKFKERNGTVLCREILRHDISTPEGMVAAEEKNLFASKCVKAVNDAAEILEEILNNGDSPAR